MTYTATNARPAQREYEEYNSGVVRARASGLILECDRDARSIDPATYTPHSHIASGFTLSNTRPLAASAIPLLRTLAEPATARVSFLELGPGAGHACAEVSRFFENAGLLGEITTASLDPINPYLRPNFTLCRTDGGLILRGNGSERVLENIAALPGAKLLQLDKEMNGALFDRVERPFINRQLIGNLTGPVSFDQRGFDFIYDCLGGLHYTLHEPCNGTVLAKTIPAISPKGLLYSNSCYPEQKIPLIKAFCTEGQIVICSSRDLLIAGKDSNLRKILSSCLPPAALSTKEAVVVCVDDLDKAIADWVIG